MDIVFEHVSKSYGDKTVFNDFSCTFKDRSFTCVMGASGIGKTTLLNLISGLAKPDEGKVFGAKKGRISYVFQEDRLCENIDAKENVLLVLKNDADKSVLKEVFCRLGLDFDDKRPVKEYSGGQKRRVAIARALLAEADVLLLDEPLKGLDDETREKTLGLIKDMARGKTVIMVTHNESEAARFEAGILNL